MRKTQFMFLVLFLSFFIYSCQEDDGEPNDSIIEDTEDKDSTDKIIADLNSYFPMSEGSWWEYRSILFGGAVEQFYKVEAGETKVLEGQEYSELKTIGLTKLAYYRKEGSVLYRLLTKDELGDDGYLEIIYIDEAYGVGKIWNSEEFRYQYSPARINREIIEKLDTTSFGGEVYSDILHIRQVFQYLPRADGQWFDLVITEEYFAKGIGYLGMKGDTGDEGISLLDYQIK